MNKEGIRSPSTDMVFFPVFIEVTRSLYFTPRSTFVPLDLSSEGCFFFTSLTYQRLQKYSLRVAIMEERGGGGSRECHPVCFCSASFPTPVRIWRQRLFVAARFTAKHLEMTAFWRTPCCADVQNSKCVILNSRLNFWHL